MQQLTSSLANEYSPHYSAAGGLVYISHHEDIYSVHTVNDGVERVLVSDSTYKGNPVWSPDGGSIAYISGVGEEEFSWLYPQYLLVLQDVESGIEEILLTGTMVHGSKWSPDGKVIAFTANLEGTRNQYNRNQNLYLMDMETREVTPHREHVTEVIFNQTDFVWMDDGQSLVVLGSTGYDSFLFKMDSQTGDLDEMFEEEFVDAVVSIN